MYSGIPVTRSMFVGLDESEPASEAPYELPRVDPTLGRMYPLMVWQRGRRDTLKARGKDYGVNTGGVVLSKEQIDEAIEAFFEAYQRPPAPPRVASDREKNGGAVWWLVESRPNDTFEGWWRDDSDGCGNWLTTDPLLAARYEQSEALAVADALSYFPSPFRWSKWVATEHVFVGESAVAATYEPVESSPRAASGRRFAGHTEMMAAEPKRCGVCNDCCDRSPTWCESWGDRPHANWRVAAMQLAKRAIDAERQLAEAREQLTTRESTLKSAAEILRVCADPSDDVLNGIARLAKSEREAREQLAERTKERDAAAPLVAKAAEIRDECDRLRSQLAQAREACGPVMEAIQGHLDTCDKLGTSGAWMLFGQSITTDQLRTALAWFASLPSDMPSGSGEREQVDQCPKCHSRNVATLEVVPPRGACDDCGHRWLLSSAPAAPAKEAAEGGNPVGDKTALDKRRDELIDEILGPETILPSEQRHAESTGDPDCVPGSSKVEAGQQQAGVKGEGTTADVAER